MLEKINIYQQRATAWHIVSPIFFLLFTLFFFTISFQLSSLHLFSVCSAFDILESEREHMSLWSPYRVERVENEKVNIGTISDLFSYLQSSPPVAVEKSPPEP